MTRRVDHRTAWMLLAALLALGVTRRADAATIFESGALGPTGVTWDDLVNQNVLGVNVNPDVFNGVRFEVSVPVIVSEVGGHFASPLGGDFFGAIVQLDDPNDFPDSGDLSTPDVLGVATLVFPAPSAEVFGNLTLPLDPGWYALVFGSGLFGTTGAGGAPLNNLDIGTPSYIGFQENSGWTNRPDILDNKSFVVNGRIVPESSTCSLVFFALTTLMFGGSSTLRQHK
jgi:hypothetical protein